MKKKSILFLSIIISLFLTSCTLSKNVQKEVFTVDMDSISIPVGVTEVQIDRAIGAKRKPTPVNVLYYPVEDAVCLQYRHDLITYNQFWSHKGRGKFINALEAYKKDYEERNLSKANKYKKLRQYDVAFGFLHWRLAAFSVQARANVDIELGYTFHDNFPFFAVSQREAEYIDPITRGNNRTSAPVTMLLTRARAQEIADFFDQDLLDSLVITGFNKPTVLHNFDDDYEDD